MIFIDTGPLLARYIERDQHHQAATKHWAVVQSERRRCFTSSLVVNETATLLARRTKHQFAAERVRNLLCSQVLTILRPDEADEWAALEWFEKFADQGISFTDCTSFALMAKHGIPSAFSFDRHFALAGFRVEP